MGEGAQWASPNWGPGPRQEIDVHGGASQALTREIGLSEIQNVFAEVSISSERIKLLQKSLRETHFEAAVTRWDCSSEFSRKSEVKRSGPGRVGSGEAASCTDWILGLAGGMGEGAAWGIGALGWPCTMGEGPASGKGRNSYFHLGPGVAT